jgi:hypothetical protein
MLRQWFVAGWCRWMVDGGVQGVAVWCWCRRGLGGLLLLLNHVYALTVEQAIPVSAVDVGGGGVGGWSTLV